MSLKCNSCGSTNTEIVSAKQLSEKIGDPSIMTGTKGVIDPTLVVLAIIAIAKALKGLFDWMKQKEKNDHKIIVCKQCGHWERI